LTAFSATIISAIEGFQRNEISFTDLVSAIESGVDVASESNGAFAEEMRYWWGRLEIINALQQAGTPTDRLDEIPEALFELRKLAEST